MATRRASATISSRAERPTRCIPRSSSRYTPTVAAPLPRRQRQLLGHRRGVERDGEVESSGSSISRLSLGAPTGGYANRTSSATSAITSTSSGVAQVSPTAPRRSCSVAMRGDLWVLVWGRSASRCGLGVGGHPVEIALETIEIHQRDRRLQTCGATDPVVHSSMISSAPRLCKLLVLPGYNPVARSWEIPGRLCAARPGGRPHHDRRLPLTQQ